MLYLSSLYIMPKVRFIQYFYMKKVNLLFEDPQIFPPITNSPSQDSPNLKNLSLSLQNLSLENAEHQILSKSIDAQESSFQVQDGQINFENTNSTHGQMEQTAQNECYGRIYDPGQMDLTLVQGPVITDLISIPEGNFDNQQQTPFIQGIPNASVMIYQDFSQNQDDEPDEEDNTQTTHLTPNQKKGRSNDANNAHKKMITALNQAINLAKRKQLKQLIDQVERKQNVSNLNYVKASRYGFMQYLLLLRHFFGDQFVQGIALSFGDQLSKLVQKNQKKQNSQAKTYLLNLPDYYINAFYQFISGSLESAIETIYKMDKFKQQKYMIQGIEKVMRLKQKLDTLQK